MTRDTDLIRRAYTLAYRIANTFAFCMPGSACREAVAVDAVGRAWESNLLEEDWNLVGTVLRYRIVEEIRWLRNESRSGASDRRRYVCADTYDVPVEHHAFALVDVLADSRATDPYGVIARRLLGMTLCEIGAADGVSESMVSLRLKKARGD